MTKICEDAFLVALNILCTLLVQIHSRDNTYQDFRSSNSPDISERRFLCSDSILRAFSSSSDCLAKRTCNWKIRACNQGTFWAFSSVISHISSSTTSFVLGNKRILFFHDYKSYSPSAATRKMALAGKYNSK